MTLLMLAMTMLFSLLTQSTPVASPAPAIGEPGPLAIAGEPVTMVAADPMTGLAGYAVAGDELFRADGEGGWESSSEAPDAASLIVDSDNASTVWAGSAQECYRGGGGTSSLQRSDDGGATWTELGEEGFVPLAAWSDIGVVLVHDCAGMHLSFDEGASWAMLEALPLGSQITAFAILHGPASPEGLWFATGVTGEGGTSQLYLVHVLTPGSVEVVGPVLTYYGIGSVAGREDELLMGAPQGVLTSDDQGESWSVNRNGLESTTLEQDPIDVFPADIEPGSFGLPALLVTDGGVYAGGADGVYHLPDGGNQWDQVASLDSAVEALAVEPDTGALLVDVRDGGVVRIAVTASPQATPMATPAS